MKVLYRESKDSVELDDAHWTAPEEFRLPYPLLQQVRESLKTSNSSLPASLRTLQNWSVGLLDRF